jgi:hypothetical protein
MVNGPKWKAALYIDEKAVPEQKDAIIKIYSGQAGGFFCSSHYFYWPDAWSKNNSYSIWYGWKTQVA